MTCDVDLLGDLLTSSEGRVGDVLFLISAAPSVMSTRPAGALLRRLRAPSVDTNRSQVVLVGRILP